MKTKIVTCPKCGAFFLKDRSTGKTFWRNITPHEWSALNIILDSETLQILTGRLQITYYECDNCHLVKQPLISPN